MVSRGSRSRSRLRSSSSSSSSLSSRSTGSFFRRPCLLALLLWSVINGHGDASSSSPLLSSFEEAGIVLASRNNKNHNDDGQQQQQQQQAEEEERLLFRHLSNFLSQRASSAMTAAAAAAASTTITTTTEGVPVPVGSTASSTSAAAVAASRKPALASRLHHQPMSKMTTLTTLTTTLTGKSFPRKASTKPIIATAQGFSSASSSTSTIPGRKLRMTSDHHVHRHLANGDFDDVNQVLKLIRVSLPDATIQENVGMLNIVLTAQVFDLKCFDIEIGDVNVMYQTETQTGGLGADAGGDADGPRTVTLILDVIKFDVTCSLSYEWSTNLLGGSASLISFTNNNNLRLGMTLTQPDSLTPPDRLTIDNCTSELDIIDLQFLGNGPRQQILNILDPTFRGLIEDRVNEFLCETLAPPTDPNNDQDDQNVQGGLENIASDLLGVINGIFEPYLELEANDDGDSLDDPLAAEMNFTNPDNATIINFRDPKGRLAVIVDTLLDQGSEILGEQIVVTPQGGTGTETNEQQGGDETTGGQEIMDLQVNDIIRTYLLDNDGEFVIMNRTTAANEGILIEDGTGDSINDDLTGSDGTITDDETTFEYTIKAHQVKVKGLDSMTRFDPLEEVGNQTLRAGFGWQFLELTVHLDVRLHAKNHLTNQEATVRDQMTIVVVVEDLEVSGVLFLAIDQDALGRVSLGSLLDTSNLLSCVAGTARGLSFPEFSFSISKIDPPLISGMNSVGLERVLGTLSDAIFPLFDDALVESLPFIVREFLDDEVQRVLDEPVDCSSLEPSQEFVDFNSLLLEGDGPYGNLAAFLKTLIDEELVALDEDTSIPKVNKVFIQPLTEGQSGIPGTLLFPGNLIEFNSNTFMNDNNDAETDSAGRRRLEEEEVWSGGRINFELRNASIENLDTVRPPFQLLDPDPNAPHHLDNILTLGTEAEPLRGSILLVVEIGDEVEMISSDVVKVGVELTTASLDLVVLLKILAERFLSLPLDSVFNLDCWLATIPAPELDEETGVRLSGIEATAALHRIALTLQRSTIMAECVSCTSDKLEELSQKLKDPSARKDVESFSKDIIDLVMNLLEGGFAQIHIDRLIHEAPKRCPTSPEYDPDFSTPKYEAMEFQTSDGNLAFAVAVALTTIAVVLSLFALRLILRRAVRRRHHIWLRSLPQEKVFLVYKQQCDEKETESKLNDTTTSMFRSPEVPRVMRVVMPLLILLNIGLFLSGHISVGGRVSLYLNLGGIEIDLNEFYEFSIAQSTLRLWQSGARPLAIFILLFSGIWPYTRMFMKLLVWFLPTHRLSVTRRGSLIQFLDGLAKWASVDIFVMFVFFVAFRIISTSPNNISFLPDDFWNIQVVVIPVWGLYSNMMAQLLSQILSHVLIYYQDKIVERSMNSIRENGTAIHGGTKAVPHSAAAAAETEQALQSSSPQGNRQLEKLSSHEFERPHRGEKDGLKVRPIMNLVVPIMGAGTFALIIAGSILPTFMFESMGLLGILMELNDQNVDHYSVLSILSSLFQQAEYVGTAAAYIGLTSMCIVLVLTCFVVPLLQTILLVYQWMIPLTARTRRRFFAAVEVLQSWQYIEVYVIAVIVSSMQLSSSSEALLSEYCAGLERTLAGLVMYDVLDPDQAVCFKIVSELRSGAVLLVVAAFALAFITTFVTKATVQYERDHDADARRVLKRTTTMDDDDEIEDLMASHNVEDLMTKIEPTPVLFSDIFRWCLTSSWLRGSDFRHDDDKHATGVAQKVIPLPYPSRSKLSQMETEDSFMSSSVGTTPSKKSPKIARKKSPNTKSSAADEDGDDEGEIWDCPPSPTRAQGGSESPTISMSGLVTNMSSRDDEDVEGHKVVVSATPGGSSSPFGGTNEQEEIA